MESRIISEQNFKVHLIMSENEARAFHDIVAYGVDSFMKVFKEHLGSHYIIKHEEGVKSLFKSVYNNFPSHFNKFDQARNLFDKDINK